MTLLFTWANNLNTFQVKLKHFLFLAKKMDLHVTSGEFHQNAGVPFLNALLSKIEDGFDMESVKPVQALLALDLSEVPTTDDTDFVMYGSEKMKILFSFYGRENSVTYAGRTITNPALISSHTLQRPEFWNLLRQKLCCFIKKSKIVELETEERKIAAQLNLVKAKKRNT